MEYKKREINRAVEELNESLSNVLESNSDNYIARLLQLFNKIEENNIINFIIKPYLSLELDEKSIGFINSFHNRTEFVLPANDDEEIALILQVLFQMKDNENSVMGIPFSLYQERQIDSNLYQFNDNIIRPAFNKLQRKMRYKIEDLKEIEETSIDSSEITIINIGNITSTNSQIAVGKNIKQHSESNVFDELKKVIDEEINENSLKVELISIITEMESTKTEKIKFREKYNSFITKLGSYITIISPLLPQLVAYFN